MPQLTFSGWSERDPEWNEWVDEMTADGKNTLRWEVSGIRYAILASKLFIPPNESILRSIIGYWNRSTATLITETEEIGFTFEDAAVLGNLPVRGRAPSELVRPEKKTQSDELLGTMQGEYNCLGPRTNPITPKEWRRYFRTHRKREVKHTHRGFLAYWLLPYIVPSTYSKSLQYMEKAILSLAVALYMGEEVSLASIVTANLYHDLNDIISAAQANQSIELNVTARFDLLQAWICERILPAPFLWSTSPTPTLIRLARWHGIETDITQQSGLQWRPYCVTDGSWKLPDIYRERDELVSIDQNSQHPQLQGAQDFAAMVDCNKFMGVRVAEIQRGVIRT